MSVGDGEKHDSRVSEDEFCDYVRNRRSVLLGMAIGLTGHRADAEDLLQAALAKTYLSWDKISDRAALDGYVRRAMVNTQISWWRRRRLEEYPTDEMPDVAVGDHAADSDLHELVVRALNRLPDRMRTAVTLRYLEDKSEREIATALGISLGTVKSTVSRAMAKLREDVELGGLSPSLDPGPAPWMAHRWRLGAIDGPSVGRLSWGTSSLMSEAFRASIGVKRLCGGGRCAAR
jgi:RNA polymerase sigma-70 factor (sigma-E family)